MRESEKLSLEQIRAFLQASEEIHFEGKQRQEMYEWVTAILQQHQYRQQSREVKGLLRGYLSKMTGLSRAQMTRLVGQYLDQGEVKELS